MGERGLAADVPATTEIALSLHPDGGSEITGAVILLNPAFTWGPHPQDASSQARDIRGVLAHELGHGLGLGHSCVTDDPELACTDAHAGTTMHPIYFGAEQASLSADDIDGICSIYRNATVASGEPTPVESCEVHDECDPGEWCVEAVCEREPRFGDACQFPGQCEGNACVATDEGGVCSYDCLSDQECPSSTRCTRVRNETDRRVCAPIAPAGGCSISPRGRSMTHFVFFAFVLVVLAVARRVRAPRWLAFLSFAIVAGCNDSHTDSDAGSVEDSGAIARDSGPPEADAGGV